MSRRRLFASAAVLTVGLAASLAGPRSAAAALHLRLTASSPAKDTVLAAAPSRIVLTYSQEPQLRLSAITLAGPQGNVALSPVAADSADAKKLVARVSGTMAPGAYTITWRTASSDGHVIRGTVGFTLRSGS